MAENFEVYEVRRLAGSSRYYYVLSAHSSNSASYMNMRHIAIRRELTGVENVFDYIVNAETAQGLQ
jgi:hypothetical protein